MHKYHMQIEKIVYFSMVKTEQGKEGNWHRQMNRWYHRCKRRCTWYTVWRKLSLHRPSDEPTMCFLVASDEWKRKSSEDYSTGWSDDLSRDTVGLSDALFESRQRHAKTSSSAPDELTPWSRGSDGLSDGYEETNRDGLTRSPSAPDESTHRWCIASEQLCQRVFNG
jgi:hypothetical protein